jgi:glycosyltransferase involved in cell wall biosynthesis
MNNRGRGRDRALGDQVARRYRQARRVLREEGAHGFAARLRRAAVLRIDADELVPEVRASDVLRADAGPVARDVPPLGPDGSLDLSWVMTPPAAGSGGHTTLFRIIDALERRGHRSTIYLYDVYGSDAADHEAALRAAFPAFTGEVRGVDDGIADSHAVFATSWPTAYPVQASSARGRRCYLVQDFEPSFYPMGATSTLAENTYRMGFHAITAGSWLASKLRAEYGMRTDWFDFGCDVERYQLRNRGARDGVVFYARRDAPRRGYQLGMLALELFAAERPDVTIHLYGGTPRNVAFPHVSHGRLDVGSLDLVYNRCYAGLSLSMTNVSLVPFEMMASGCVPIVNDAPQNRMVLDHPGIHYAEPTPHALAAALVDVCAMPDFTARSAEAAATMHSRSWDEAGAQVERALLRDLAPAAADAALRWTRSSTPARAAV